MINIEKNYIVCYMDILGYGNLVSKIYDRPEIVKDIKDVYSHIVGIVDGFITRDIKNEYQKAWKLVAENTKFRIISDSVLVTMELDRLPLLEEGVNANDNVITYIEMYFQLISTFYVYFASKIYYFFRGAVTIGQYYEAELNKPENIFIVSKALVNASKLEKEKADSLRIIIDESVCDYSKNTSKNGFIGKKMFEDRIFKDIDKLYCLDIYFGLPDDNPKLSRKVIEGIVKAIRFQIKENRNNPKVLRKYYHFIKYHNWKMKTRFKYEEFIIEDFEYKNLNSY